MSQDPTAPNPNPAPPGEPAPAQPALPGIEAEPAAEPEKMFPESQVDDIIARASAAAAERAVEAYKAEQAAAEDTPAEDDKPPANETEKLKLQSELEAERARSAEMESRIAAQEQSATEQSIRAQIRNLLAERKDLLADPKAMQDMENGIYRDKAFTFAEGKIVPNDPKAQPADIVTSFVASRPWFQRPLPGGSGAAPAATNTPQGTNGQSAQFDGSKFRDYHDALDAAVTWDHSQKKG